MTPRPSNSDGGERLCQRLWLLWGPLSRHGSNMLCTPQPALTRSWKAFKGSHMRGLALGPTEEGSLSSAGLYSIAYVEGVVLVKARRPHPGQALDESRLFQTATLVEGSPAT